MIIIIIIIIIMVTGTLKCPDWWLLKSLKAVREERHPGLWI
jgi:hypothetical protein